MKWLLFGAGAFLGGFLGQLLAHWLRRRFVEAAFRFELFEAENRDVADKIIKRKEAEGK